MSGSSILTFEIRRGVEGADVGMVAFDTGLAGNVGVAFYFALATRIACLVLSSLACP